MIRVVVISSVKAILNKSFRFARYSKMLRNKIIFSSFLKKVASYNIVQLAGCSSEGGFFNERQPIGKREWVGYGVTSTPNYVDRFDYPMPAVRFREITGDLIQLKEKEKGDWKKLTIEEKKKLYRASFCQTFAEVYAPTGEWKSITGYTLILISLAIWIFILEKKFLLQPRSHTFDEEHRQLMLRKMIVNRDGHLTGLSSKWDYEKDDWK